MGRMTKQKTPATLVPQGLENVETVIPSGEVSNFLLEDYEAVTKFMSVETQKKKININNDVLQLSGRGQSKIINC